jgi:hypothetical protein
MFFLMYTCKHIPENIYYMYACLLSHMEVLS